MKTNKVQLLFKSEDYSFNEKTFVRSHAHRSRIDVRMLGLHSPTRLVGRLR